MRHPTLTLKPISQGAAPTETILVTDINGDPVDLTGLSLSMVFWVPGKPANPVHQYTTGGGGLAKGEADNALIVTHDDALSAYVRRLAWALWDTDGDDVLLSGTADIVEAGEPY